MGPIIILRDAIFQFGGTLALLAAAAACRRRSCPGLIESDRTHWALR